MAGGCAWALRVSAGGAADAVAGALAGADGFAVTTGTDSV
jgi:hypothetical protein